MLGPEARTPVGPDPRSGLEQRAPDTRSDAQLLEAMGRQRQEAALEELFRRHQTRLYNQALLLTQDQAMARDALQESMMNVWEAAPRYVDGKPQAWLLQIVSRKCLSLLRSERVRRRYAAKARKGGEAARTEAVEERLDRQEIVSRLRTALEQLPGADRRLIALHFGAGLSQRETARLLGLPQSTLNLRCAQILDELRVEMGRAGALALLPLLETELLNQAILSARQVPEALLQALFDEFKARAAGSASAPSPARSLPRRLSALLVGIVLAGVGLAGWAGLGLLREDPAAVPSAGQVIGDASTLLFRHDFKDPPGPGFVPWLDRWLWRPPGSDGVGRLIAPQLKPGGVLALPLPLQAGRPFKVSIWYRPSEPLPGYLSLQWAKEMVLLPHLRYRLGSLGGELNLGRETTLTFFGMDRWIITYADSVPLVLSQFEAPAQSGEQLVLVAQGLEFGGLEMRRVTESELPLSRREIAELTASRLGTVSRVQLCKEYPAGPALHRLGGNGVQHWHERLGLEQEAEADDRAELFYDFQKGPEVAGGFRVLEGSWEWTKNYGREAAAGMLVTPGQSVTIEAPALPLHRSPWRLEYSITRASAAGDEVRVALSDAGRAVPARGWQSPFPVTVEPPHRTLLDYGLGNFLMATTTGGRPLDVMEVREVLPRHRLVLILSNVVLETLRWSPLKVQETPVGIRELDRVLRGRPMRLSTPQGKE